MACSKHHGQPSPYKWSMPSFAVTNLEQALISAQHVASCWLIPAESIPHMHLNSYPFLYKAKRHLQGKIRRVDCISKSWINAADGNFLMDASSQSRRTTIDMLVKTSTVLCNNPPRHSIN
ncbi:hypothetical protein NC652_026960 [Populus alba x Populus x berolinensis]|nr:hypothetical protein NC652_026960 [Populus alba x Populus x berolinensis]